MPVDFVPDEKVQIDFQPDDEPGIHLGPREQSRLEAEGEAAWKAQPKTGFFGGLAEGFISPIKSTGRGWGVGLLSDETLQTHLENEYAKSTTAPELTGSGKAGQFIGGIAGNVAQAVPLARAAGVLGLIAQFGSAGAYDEFMKAGMRALSEGKTPEEAVSIGKKASVAGGVVGGVIGAVAPGAGKQAASQVLKTAGKLAGVAGVGRVGENVTERALGLQTPITEGALEESAVMGLLPVGTHYAGRALSRFTAPQERPPAAEALVPKQLPFRTGGIEMPDVQQAPADLSSIGEMLKTAPAVAPRELAIPEPRRIPERVTAIEMPDEARPPRTLAEVEAFLRDLPPPEEPPAEGGVPAEPTPKPPAPAPPQPAVPAAEPVSALERIKSGENEGRIAIILPDGRAVVGGVSHPTTWTDAVQSGAFTDAELSNGIGGFVRPDGTAWAVNGEQLPKVTQVVIVSEKLAKGAKNALQIGETETLPVAPSPGDRPPLEPQVREQAPAVEKPSDVQKAQEVEPPSDVGGQAGTVNEIQGRIDSANENIAAIERRMKRTKNQGAREKLARTAGQWNFLKQAAETELSKVQQPPAATPAAGAGEGKRRRTLREIREDLERQRNLGSEAGFINISIIGDKLERLRDDIAIAWKTGKVRAVMTYKKDAAMNAADAYANEVKNGVRNLLYRATGTKIDATKEGGAARNILTPWKDPNAVQKTALTMGVESYADAPAGSPETGLTGVDRMRVQRQRLAAWTPPRAELQPWKDLALKGLDYAIVHWAEIEPVVRRYNAETDMQVAHEIAAGVDTLKRNGYVLHETDLEGISPFDFLTSKAGSESASFLKKRVYPTYVDKIMGGSLPKSLDAVALLGRRIQVGQRKINNRAWTQQLRSVLDETSGQPLLTEPNYETRADGKSYPVPPTRNYTIHYMGFEPYAIHKGYEGPFEALNSPSFFARSLAARSLMEGVGVTKHLVLAFDTFHLGRLALWSSIMQSRPVQYKKGLVLLDYSLPEIREMVRRGEVPAEYAADLIENKRQLGLALKTGYNMTRIQDALWQDWTQKIPITGAFNKWLFGQFQRGAMVQSWLAEFARQKKQNPAMPEVDLARKVSTELNTRFGNLQNQGVFRSKSAQDAARLTFLAPQWNEGLIRSEIGAVAGLGKTGYDLATKGKFAVSALTRGAGILFLAQFAANQLINYITRGHSTLENPEEGADSKLSAYIPDIVGDGPGLFISPLALPAEVAHLIYKRFERSKDFDDALKAYARTRLGTVSRPFYTWATSTDVFGRAIRSEDLWKEVLKAATPIPISGGAAFQAARQVATGEKAEQFPGQFQKQAMASVGVKTESVPTASQQISTLAKEWNKKRGMREPGPSYQSDYSNLDRFLRVGNTVDALKELELIRQKHTDDQIAKRFQVMPQTKFTHSSSDNEARFYSTLTDVQRTAYIQARRERIELARRFWQLWAKRPMRAMEPRE